MSLSVWQKTSGTLSTSLSGVHDSKMRGRRRARSSTQSSASDESGVPPRAKAPPDASEKSPSKNGVVNASQFA